MNENFFFVAAREVFDYSLGLRGWFFQRLGVYSLVRGSNDRKSLKTSMEILSKNKGRLVIFVEGEISNQNETLLPLESGVIQLAFMALNDMYKEKGKDLAALPSLYVCPVGLRYIYDVRGLDKAIDKSIHRLEEALGLLNSGKTVWFERVRTIAGVVMREASAQIGYPLDESLPLADNVRNVSGFMLTKLEQIINLPPDAALSPLDRIRRIRNLLDQVLNQEAEAEPTDYQKRLNDHRKDVLQNLYQDLDRVVNFIAVYDGYLQPDMADFRYVELLRRMEREVFGQFHLVHPRKGHVEVMEPIDLRDHFADFLQDKKAVVERIAADVERKIYAGVEAGGL